MEPLYHIDLLRWAMMTSISLTPHFAESERSESFRQQRFVMWLLHNPVPLTRV